MDWRRLDALFDRAGDARRAASYRLRLESLPLPVVDVRRVPGGDASPETLCRVAAERPEDLFRPVGAES